jgi:hypothetical protein
MMRDVMRGIDAATAQMTHRDTTIGEGADSLYHHLTVWLQGGVPRKLIAIDSAAAGGSNIETDVWFMGGDVAVVLQVADAFAFDAGRIVLWTDEAFQPRSDVTADLVMAKQGTLITMVQGWLAPFRIQLP